jgi:hypothetical protein
VKQLALGRVCRLALATAAVSVGLALSASGAGAMTASPTSLTFPDQAVGTRSAPQTVTLTACPLVGPNGTCSSSSFSGQVSPAQDYEQTSDCPATMLPGTTCTMEIVFKPTTIGHHTATVSTGADLSVSGGTQKGPTISLSGNGIIPTFTQKSCGRKPKKRKKRLAATAGKKNCTAKKESHRKKH